MKKHGSYWLLLLTSFVFVTLFSRSTSFLYVFEGADPSIFKQMGRALLNGKILYVDYFDNKGCLLYFIHALGEWLGGDIFLLLFQTISLFVTLLIWSKMLALFRDRRGVIICLAIALGMLCCFYGAGDQTQEWCLPFISYPLWVFIRSYKNKSEIQPKHLFHIGLCFGIITFIQVNNACAFLGFIAYLWILYLRKKEYKKLFLSIACFFVGWAIIAAICVSYFYVKAGWHGVYEMVYASFLSNFEYLEIQHRRKWYYWVPYLTFLISLLFIQILNNRKEKQLLIPFLISFALFVGTFGKRCSSFYLIAILPLVIVSMTTFHLMDFKRLKIGILAMAMVGIVFMGSIVVFHLINDLILQKEKEIAIYEHFHHCFESIPKNERDSIYNYNLGWHGTSMMESEGTIQCNRVLFTPFATNLPTLMKEELSKPLVIPQWILFSFDFRYSPDDAYFIQKNYDLCCEFQYDKLYFEKPRIGNKFQVNLYRRKSS